jgi:hypothetical protein
VVVVEVLETDHQKAEVVVAPEVITYFLNII